MLLTILMIAAQAASGAPSTPPVDPHHELKLDFQIDAAFLAANDRDGDGALSLSEFEAAIDKRLDTAIAANPDARQKIGPPQRVRIHDMMAATFRSLDRDSDGRLTLAEVKAHAHAGAADAPNGAGQPAS